MKWEWGHWQNESAETENQKISFQIEYIENAESLKSLLNYVLSKTMIPQE